MKRHIITYIYCLISTIACCQDQDTISISAANTVSMIFPENIEVFTPGGNLTNVVSRPDLKAVISSEYTFQKDEDLLTIRAMKAKVPSTSLLVRAGKEYYFFYIVYDSLNSRYFHDYRRAENSMATSLSIVKLSVQEKTDSVGHCVNEIQSIGIKEGFITAGVTAMRNDGDNTYLKLVVQNTSTLPYDLGYVSFEYVRKMKKGFLRRRKEKAEEVIPLIKPVIKSVNGSSLITLPFAISSFALANKGYLLIILREKKGDRTIKIKVSGRDIQKAKEI